MELKTLVQLVNLASSLSTSSNISVSSIRHYQCPYKYIMLDARPHQGGHRHLSLDIEASPLQFLTFISEHPMSRNAGFELPQSRTILNNFALLDSSIYLAI